MIALWSLAFAAEPVSAEPAPPAPTEAPSVPSPAPEAAPVPAPGSEPAASEPAASEPAASEPAASEPTTSEPAASEPAASEPVPEAPAPLVEVEPAPPPRSSGTVDRIAVVVNDDLITLSDIYDIGRDFVLQRCPTGEARCVTEAEIEIADALIKRALIEQELKRLDLEVTAVEVDHAIDGIVQQYQLPDRQALKDEVERSGKRWEDYRQELEEYLRTQAFQSRILAPRVSVTDDELRDAYQRVARKVKTPVATASAIGIGIPPETDPDAVGEMIRQTYELVKSLNAGEIAWDEAVGLYDSGMAALFAGQEFTPNSLLETFRAPVFEGEVGVVQPPVQFTTPSGVEVLVLVRVDTRGERSEALPFEEVEAQLQEQVFQEKLEAAEEEWYQRARREAAVVVKLGES